MAILRSTRATFYHRRASTSNPIQGKNRIHYINKRLRRRTCVSLSLSLSLSLSNGVTNAISVIQTNRAYARGFAKCLDVQHRDMSSAVYCVRFTANGEQALPWQRPRTARESRLINNRHHPMRLHVITTG
jgi:uncharacterized membrane protein YccC